MHVRRNSALLVIAVTAVGAAVCLPVETSAGKFRNPLRKVTTVERLAADIDCLERFVEDNGSVVAKQPDVWGQSRLTKFRQEYEDQLKTQLTTFKETINATIKRSDQAFLASAFALQAASLGTAAAPAPLTTLIGDVGSGTQTIFARDATHAVPGGPFTTDGTSAFTGIALEPTVVLDQMSRYINHLHELRRINTGDDTAASPGYSLYMLRFPVSVLPGKKTRQGYGAEVTISIDPYLSDDLLPSTFRKLVINDVVDQLSVLATKALNDKDTMLCVNKYMQFVRGEVSDLSANPQRASAKGTDQAIVDEMKANIANNKDKFGQIPLPALVRIGRTGLHVKPSRTSLGIRNARLPIPSSYFGDVFGCGAEMIGPILFDLWDSPDKTDDCDAGGKPCAPGAASGDPILHLVDVENLLEAELQAAYDFLSQDAALPLWNHCTPNLARTIRLHGKYNTKVDERHSHRSVASLRKDFYIDFGAMFPRAEHTATSCLAWAIIVEAALLNEAILDDIRQTATAKNCACAITDDMQFYYPNPPFEARESFRQYVRCRWPVHAFALDPVTQDQNVADSFSRRREMQLALSLAFASGQTGPQSFTRFARRLELDMDTIALNRTIIGFSHGNETIGWRFYPRVQTPDTESNATVLFRDMLWGGPSRDCEMKAWRLEPGVRECTALVIMPSFVPYVTYDVRSNWFSLVNPRKKQLDVRDATDLSRSIQSMRCAASACIKDECLYRDGEVHRLLKAVDQIEARLPMQCAYAQIPFENTLSGFELVDTGVTALAPELRDWYGAPGVDVSTKTDLFLIGDHFSVHETSVIIGDTSISPTIINRQTLKVSIPSGARPLRGGAEIEARVATPYGVSAPVLIPVVSSSAPAKKTGLKWDPDTIVMYYEYDADGHFTGTGEELANPKSFAIAAPDLLQAKTAILELSFKTAGGADVGKSPKITLTDVPFDGKQFVIGTNKDGTGKYPEVMPKIKALFGSFFTKTGNPATNVVVSVKIQIDGSPDVTTTDNSLAFKLLPAKEETDAAPAVAPPAPGAAASGPALPKTSQRTKAHAPLAPETLCAPIEIALPTAPGIDLVGAEGQLANRKPRSRPSAAGAKNVAPTVRSERRAPQSVGAIPRVTPAQHTESPYGAGIEK